MFWIHESLIIAWAAIQFGVLLFLRVALIRCKHTSFTFCSLTKDGHLSLAYKLNSNKQHAFFIDGPISTPVFKSPPLISWLSGFFNALNNATPLVQSNRINAVSVSIVHVVLTTLVGLSTALAIGSFAAVAHSVSAIHYCLTGYFLKT